MDIRKTFGLLIFSQFLPEWLSCNVLYCSTGSVVMIFSRPLRAEKTKPNGVDFERNSSEDLRKSTNFVFSSFFDEIFLVIDLYTGLLFQ